jgi:hypothetical protein
MMRSTRPDSEINNFATRRLWKEWTQTETATCYKNAVPEVGLYALCIHGQVHERRTMYQIKSMSI